MSKFNSIIVLFLLIIFSACSLEGDINGKRKNTGDGFSIPAPGTPKVNPADSLLTLNWTAVEEAVTYDVFISTSQNPPSKPERTVSSTTIVLDGLSNKTVYYLWIKAKDESRTSDFSPRARGTPWPVNEIPATPGRPVIIPGVNRLTVTWDECGGAASYEVYINTSTSKPQAPEIIADKTSAVIENLNNDIIYYLWVRAVNSVGKSEYSPLEAGTPRVPTVAPSAPARPELSAGSRELTVSWDAVELASAYEIWLGTTDKSGEAQKWGTDITGSTTEIVITGLTNDTIYYVWIKAKNLIGTSLFSPSANARPSAFAAAPVAPAMPTVVPGFSAMDVNWQAAEGALSYEIWTGISNNPASAAKYGADVSATSITLTGLVNETTYYVWIKAKNNIETSAFSPMAIGTPSVFIVKPSAPQTAPTVIAGSGQLSISWQPVTGASVYEVWAGTSSDSNAAIKRGSDVSGLSAVIGSLTNGTTYYVWIKAKNGAGTSGFGPMGSGTPSAFAAAPLTPGMPIVIPGLGAMDVNWQAAEGALSYELWTGISNNPDSASKYGTDISGTSITLTGLENETTYYVWIKAKNNINTSAFSPMASGTPSVFIVKPSAPLTAPTVTAGSEQLSISWQPVSGAVVYEVWAGTANNSDASTKRGNDVSGLSTVIGSLINGTTYYVWIKAKNNIGPSGFSPVAIGTPQIYTVVPQAPAAPSINIGNGQISITWTAVQAAASYEIWLATDSNSSSATKYGADISAVLSATISGLNNGTMYYIWLKAKNVSGTSDFSFVVSGKPIANSPVPTLVSGNSQINVNWTAIAGADQYEIFCGTGINPPQTAALIVNAPEITASVSGLVNGTSYNVWVRGKNLTGTGIISSSVSAIPLGNMGTVTLSTGNQQLLINWPIVAGAEQYEVYHSTGSTMPGSPTQTVSATITTIGNLSNGTTYNVWVRAKNMSGMSNVSNIVYGKPIANAIAPSLISESAQIIVNWIAIAGADQYEIFCGIDINLPQTASLTVNAPLTTAAITGIANGTSYNVWIRGKNSIGTGAMSSPVNAKPLGNVETVSVSAGYQQLLVSWPSVPGADQYEIYHSISSTIPGSPSHIVSVTTATINSLSNGTTYYIWVRAKNANGNTTSTVVNVKPLGTPDTPTITPGYRQLVVSWAVVPGANEYEVYYGIGSPSILATTTTGTTATIGNLLGGTSYNVRLRAKNNNGISDYGLSASGAPNDALSPGLYRNGSKIGNQDLSMSLSYILTNATNNDDFIIVLGEGEYIVKPMTLVFSGRIVKITLQGYENQTILRLSSNGNMFAITANVTLILNENIALVGCSQNTDSLVKVFANSTLILNESAEIHNSFNEQNNSKGGGCVYIAGNGNFTMNGGTIVGGHLGDGGSVYVDSNGIFIMSGGIISGSTYARGGGVFINSYGTFTMSGGIISNSNSASGGGVFINNNGTFTMSSGKICNNSVSASSNAYGGGVFANSMAIFTMSGGIISANFVCASGNAYGGGVFTNSMATFTMSGGIIYGNEVISNYNSAYGGGVYGVINKVSPIGGEQNTGIIYGNDETGVDIYGYPLKNTVSIGGYGHAVYNSSLKQRNNTAWETDQIDTATGKGLSANGNPPYGQ